MSAAKRRAEAERCKADLLAALDEWKLAEIMVRDGLMFPGAADLAAARSSEALRVYKLARDAENDAFAGWFDHDDDMGLN